MNDIILGLYPNTYGLGYVCVELPNNLLDYGIMKVRPTSNEEILKRSKKLMESLSPNIVVLRDSNALTVKEERIKEVVNEITEQAIEQGIIVHQYSRQQMKFVGEQFEVSNKYEMAEWLAKHFSDLADRIPRFTNWCEPEDRNMGIFDALTLVICYAYYTM